MNPQFNSISFSSSASSLTSPDPLTFTPTPAVINANSNANANASGVVSNSNNFIVPTSSAGDKRKYGFRVLSNGLRVLLISDPVTDKAAAAMDVNVGHMSDPNHLPGLAHYLEHMLFLGTSKFPDENEYSSYLNKHGGHSNAFTSAENTNYYFDVTHSNFKGALDRFAQFFISPLFNQSAASRELSAVDNENAKNHQNDSWRLYQLLKGTCNESHPFSKFGSGHRQSLGLCSREELLDFHKKYYSANTMALTLLGREPVSVLNEWVDQFFLSIPNTNAQIPKFDTNVFTQNNLGRKYSVVPIKEDRSLVINWPFPSMINHYRSKPHHVLSHLLGHEGQGSLFKKLKSNGWANSLSAGLTANQSSFSLFGIHIELTEEGLTKTNEITALTYQYISLLKSASSDKWAEIYKEVSDLAQLNFRFKSKENPSSYVSSLAGQFNHGYEVMDILTGPWLYQDFNLGLIHDLLAMLNPSNMRMQVVTQDFKGKTSLTEKWYGTEYDVQVIEKDLMKLFDDANVQQAHSNELHIPNPNPFIATDHTIKFTQQIDPPPTRSSVVPILVELPSSLSESSIELFWKLDDLFGNPKVNIHMRLMSPVAYSSPSNHVLTVLFTHLLEDSLNAFAYDAQLAGLSYSLTASISGLNLVFRGYNQKMPVLVEAVLTEMKSLKIDPLRFELIKEQLGRSLRNFKLEQPYNHALDDESHIFDDVRWSKEEMSNVLTSFTSQDVQNFYPLLLEQLSIQMLVHGNMYKEEGISLAEMLQNKIKFKKPFESQLPSLRVVQLSDGHAYVKLARTHNPDDKNSATVTTFQVGPDSLFNTARTELVAHINKEAAFNQLRTNEQLGYLVWSSIANPRGVLNYKFIIQSSEYSPSYMARRIDAFLADKRNKLALMENELFESNKAAVIAKKDEVDKTLRDETNRYWNEIVIHRYQFNRSSLEINELRELKLEELLRFWDKHFSLNSLNRRRLSILYFSKNHQIPSSADIQRGILNEAEATQGKSQSLQKENEEEKGKQSSEALGPGSKEPGNSNVNVDAVNLPPNVFDNAPITVIDNPGKFKRSMPLYPAFI